jgi:hypothetical protein
MESMEFLGFFEVNDVSVLLIKHLLFTLALEFKILKVFREEKGYDGKHGRYGGKKGVLMGRWEQLRVISSEVQRIGMYFIKNTAN